MAADTARPLTFATIGLDHRHIYEMMGRLLDQGGECVGCWTEGEPQPITGFITRYTHMPQAADKHRLLEDPTAELILTAAINSNRSATAIEAMRYGPLWAYRIVGAAVIMPVVKSEVSIYLKEISTYSPVGR